MSRKALPEKRSPLPRHEAPLRRSRPAKPRARIRDLPRTPDGRKRGRTGPPSDFEESRNSACHSPFRPQAIVWAWRKRTIAMKTRARSIGVLKGPGAPSPGGRRRCHCKRVRSRHGDFPQKTGVFAFAFRPDTLYTTTTWFLRLVRRIARTRYDRRRASRTE